MEDKKLEEEILEVLGSYRPYYEEGKFNNFRQITRNFAQAVTTNYVLGKQEIIEELKQTIRKYIILLDEFPDFREEQLTPRREPTASFEDIDEMYERLKGKRKSR